MKTSTQRNGQAMVELIVALVAMLALAAGVFQLTTLLRAQTDTMVAARREAAGLAMRDFGAQTTVMADPDYIRDWQVGPDGRHHTRDDSPTAGHPMAFDQRIVERAAGEAAGWDLLDRASNRRLPRLRGDPDPVAHFGLVRGRATESVPLLAAVRNLLYRADAVDVESEVWLTRTADLY